MTDYISREAAVKAVCTGCSPQFCSLDCDIATAVKSIPAADVRPVVRGKWVQTGGKYSRHKTIVRRILTCSVCGNSLYMEGVNAGRGDANFCPNCWADMREES